VNSKYEISEDHKEIKLIDDDDFSCAWIEGNLERVKLKIHINDEDNYCFYIGIGTD